MLRLTKGYLGPTRISPDFGLFAKSIYYFGLFDTGSNLVTIEDPAHTDRLEITEALLVDVRINSLAVIEHDDLTAPLGPPFAAAQAEAGGIMVGPRTDIPSLMGAPIANGVLALIDNTTPSRRGEYGFVVPDDHTDPAVNGDRYVDGHDITFSMPGMVGMPVPSVTLELERFGNTTPAGDGATKGQRYLLRNVDFMNTIGATTHSVDDQDPADQYYFSYDTGSTVTIIGDRLATALGIPSGTPGSTFSCLSGTNNGYRISSVVMSGTGGEYIVNSASVCVSQADITTTHDSGALVDAVIGSNLFDQVAVLFDGPANTLGVVTREQICWPPHRGVPYDPAAPTVDGVVQEDTGWKGAHRLTYGDGAEPAHAAVQALRHSTEASLYVSAEVRNDPSFDNDDVVVINFRPSAKGSSPKDDIRIFIYPLCDGTGAAGPGCDLITPDDKSDRPPRLVRVWKNSANWTEMTPLPATLEVKVRSYPDGSTNAWNIEVKVPTDKATGGADWVDFADEFLFYSNIIRVSTTDDTATQFRWPRNALQVADGIAIEAYLFTPAAWGKGKDMHCHPA